MSTPKPWSELATRITPERRAELDAEVKTLAGEDFMARLHAAVQRPAWPESVMEALSEGPEICGGHEADPDEPEPEAGEGMRMSKEAIARVVRPNAHVILRTVRERRGCSVEDVARAVGVGPQRLLEIESGDLRPSEVQIQAFAEATRSSASVLLSAFGYVRDSATDHARASVAANRELLERLAKAEADE